MPKIKTKRGAAKRLKLTATGRLKFRRAYRNHILTKKSPKLKGRLTLIQNTDSYKELEKAVAQYSGS